MREITPRRDSAQPARDYHDSWNRGVGWIDALDENITRKPRRKPRRVSLRVSSRFQPPKIFRVSQLEATLKLPRNDAGCKDPPRKIVHQDRVYNRPSFQVSNGFERKEDKKNKLTLEYIYIYILYTRLIDTYFLDNYS